MLVGENYWKRLEKKYDSKLMRLNIITQGNSLSLTLKLEADNIARVAEKVRDSSRFIFSGAGDKLIVPSISKFLWDHLSKKPLLVYHSRLLADYKIKLDRDTCVVLLTQSGTTKDTLDACRVCMQNGCTIVAITNLQQPTKDEEDIISLLAKYENGHLIRTHTLLYPEDPLPSTGTFHTSLMALNLLVLYLNGNKEMLDLHLNKIPELVDRLSRDEGVMNWAKRTASKIYSRNFLYVVGDGPRYYVAKKHARIMLMEGVKMDASAVEAEEFVHSLIETLEFQHRRMILLKPLESWDEKNYTLIEKLWSKHSGSDKVIVCDPFAFLGDDERDAFSGFEGNLISPFLYMIPLEWQGFYLALLRKVDPGIGRLVSKVRDSTELKKLIN